MAKVKDKAAQELGKKGGKARAAKLTPEERSARASAAAKARWGRLGTEERTAATKKMRRAAIKKRKSK